MVSKLILNEKPEVVINGYPPFTLGFTWITQPPQEFLKSRWPVARGFFCFLEQKICLPASPLSFENPWPLSKMGRAIRCAVTSKSS
jgi:hypothetical protein